MHSSTCYKVRDWPALWMYLLGDCVRCHVLRLHSFTQVHPALCESCRVNVLMKKPPKKNGPMPPYSIYTLSLIHSTALDNAIPPAGKLVHSSSTALPGQSAG